ncbi:MAG: transglycosylase domain-containing protein [Bacteroidia bacterium]|nr:transglycosylase domain-containing protein [Bacteroidia bacterium]
MQEFFQRTLAILTRKNTWMALLAAIAPWLKKLKRAWDKLWFYSFFNRSRFKQIGFGKKLLSLGYTLLACIALFILAMEMNFLWLFGYLPSMRDVINPRVSLPTEVYSSDNQLIGSFYIVQRKPVTFEEINPETIEALIATEDIRFYQHSGLDIYALFGAVFSTVSGSKRGGSTITQQLVKNIYDTRRASSGGLLGLIPVVSTISAKLKEWNTALKIEFFLEKNEILTLYLNAVDFGNNSHGLKIASEYYFSKEPKNLKTEESALLIGMLKGPSLYNPRKNLELAEERRNVVLSQMEKYGYLTTEEKEKLAKKPIRLKIKEIVKEKTVAPYFRAALVRDLTEWAEDNNYNLYTDGLKIYTTLDSRMQKYAETAVKQNMIWIQRSFESGFGGYKYWFDSKIAQEKKDYLKENPLPKGQKLSDVSLPPMPTEILLQSLIEQSDTYKRLIASGKTKEETLEEMNKPARRTLFYQNNERNVRVSSVDSIKHIAQIMHCGLVSIEPTTGAVKAWVGGINWNWFQYDHIDQAKRQAGSTFKAILYAAALQNDLEPCSMFTDKPVSYLTENDGKEEIWDPQNSDEVFTNKEMTLRTAVAKSVNTIAAQVTEQIGPDEVIKMARKLGIESELDETLSIGLGPSSVSLLELTRAYTVFCNQGRLCETRLVDRILDYDNKEIEVFEPKSRKAISSRDAYSMVFMLRGSVEESGGTSRRLYNYGICNNNEVGGKTGTSTNYADGWYVGITPALVTGVWVGAENMKIHFENANGQGGRTALPIFGQYMQMVYSNSKTGIKRGKFTVPEDYDVNLECSKTSSKSSAVTPSVAPATTPGVSPIPEPDVPAESLVKDSAQKTGDTVVPERPGDNPGQ